MSTLTTSDISNRVLERPAAALFLADSEPLVKNPGSGTGQPLDEKAFLPLMKPCANNLPAMQTIVLI